MNREIKFRGLRVDGNGWVYGDLVRHYGLSSVYSKITPHISVEETWNGETTFAQYEVVQESVGQFTRLIDKGGKEIYHGDVAKWIDEEKEYKGDYFWSKDACGFRIQMPKGYMPSFNLQSKHTEIIGNVFQNPELLTK